jgi:hypothetical protein
MQEWCPPDPSRSAVEPNPSHQARAQRKECPMRTARTIHAPTPNPRTAHTPEEDGQGGTTPADAAVSRGGRCRDRTSDLRRVKVSGGHFARLENRRDTATGLVSHGFRTLSVVRWFSVVLSVMWTRCGRRPVEVSVPCVPVTPTALSSGVGSTERPVEASMSADMGLSCCICGWVGEVPSG